jgi:hypothetical protein
MVVSWREAQGRELSTGVRAIAEGLPVATATGAPEISPSELQRDGAGAWLSDGVIGHRGSKKTVQI